MNRASAMTPSCKPVDWVKRVLLMKALMSLRVAIKFALSLIIVIVPSYSLITWLCCLNHRMDQRGKFM